MLILNITSLQQTVEFGRRLAEIARPGDVLTLEGDLGAGKTTLTQAIGAGLEVPADFYISSPTFSLLHEYPGRIPLYHMDLYRLSGPEEIEHLGFEDFIYGRGLTVIEWPDRLAELMPAERLRIIITGNQSGINSQAEECRRIQLEFHGPAWTKRKSLLAETFERTIR